MIARDPLVMWSFVFPQVRSLVYWKQKKKKGKEPQRRSKWSILTYGVPSMYALITACWWHRMLSAGVATGAPRSRAQNVECCTLPDATESTNPTHTHTRGETNGERAARTEN